MLPLISFFLVVTLSALVTRIATVALMFTGVSRDVASFQAVSAFTGVGLTSDETEQIIAHPVRRRILKIVMRLGSFGLITTMTALLLTFVDASGSEEEMARLVWLIIGIALLAFLGTRRSIDRALSRVIQWALRRYTALDTHDYAALFHLSDGYRIIEMAVKADSWIASKTLGESQLRQEGVIALGIYRKDGSYIGAPYGDTPIFPGDQLILYGRDEDLREIDQRLMRQPQDSPVTRRH